MKKLILILITISFTHFSFSQKKELKTVEKLIKSNNYTEAINILGSLNDLINSADDKTKAKFYYLSGLANYQNGESSFENKLSSIENFNNAKEAVLQKIRTERITKTKVLDYYEAAQKIKIDYDQRKDLYDNISDFSMENLREFHNSHVSNDNYTYMILGNIEDLNMDILKRYANVKVLSLEDIFGY